LDEILTGENILSTTVAGIHVTMRGGREADSGPHPGRNFTSEKNPLFSFSHFLRIQFNTYSTTHSNQAVDGNQYPEVPI